MLNYTPEVLIFPLMCCCTCTPLISPHLISTLRSGSRARASLLRWRRTRPGLTPPSDPVDICGPSPWLGDRGRACHEQGDATCWGVLWFGMGRCCSPQLKKQRIYAIRVTVPRMKTRKSPAASAILNFSHPVNGI